MKISFTRVTWYSQIAALVIFVGVYILGFYVGQEYEISKVAITPAATLTTTAPVQMTSENVKLINNVTFVCPAPRFIAAQFLEDSSGRGSVDLELSDGRSFILSQTVSADGARYANADGSFVFWNKGNGAFIQENGTTTWNGCVTK